VLLYQFDHLRLAGRDYHGEHVDLWESHPRRRFGGLPASFWLGLQEAQEAHGAMTGEGGGGVCPLGALGASERFRDLEEFAMYRRYLHSLYGLKALGGPPREGMVPGQGDWRLGEVGTPGEAAVAAPLGHPHPEPLHLSPDLGGPPMDLDQLYPPPDLPDAPPPLGPPSWLGPAASGASAGVMAATAVYKMLGKHKGGREGEGEGEDAVGVLSQEGALMALARGGKDGALTTVDGWNARVAQSARWSQLRRYAFVKSLGKGAHAETLLVNRGGKPFVLKESELLPEAVNEARLLGQVVSQHVVRLEDFFIESLGHRHVAYLQLEYCDGGDLAALIRQDWRDLRMILDDQNVRNILAQIAEGLWAMHSKHIVHRDLKPENILLTTTGCVKIADLGVSTRLTASLPKTTCAAGSVPFMAPEVRRFLLGENVSYNEKADIWALGALAYAMCMGTTVPNIANVPAPNVVKEVSRHRGWSPSASVLADQVCRVLLFALDPTPADRPDAQELCHVLADVNAPRPKNPPLRLSKL
jgi:hypothetical protein